MKMTTPFTNGKYIHFHGNRIFATNVTKWLNLLISPVRCREALEDGFVQVRELQRQLQRLRKDQEELEERNEELEALLGEAQNASKEDRHRHDGELEGLQRRVMSSTQSLFSNWIKDHDCGLGTFQQ